MVKVTGQYEAIRYTGQEGDERSRLLADLEANQTEYLSHADSIVRSRADWTLEFYGLRKIRPQIPDRDRFPANTFNARTSLFMLYSRLRELARKG